MARLPSRPGGFELSGSGYNEHCDTAVNTNLHEVVPGNMIAQSMPVGATPQGLHRGELQPTCADILHHGHWSVGSLVFILALTERSPARLYCWSA